MEIKDVGFNIMALSTEPVFGRLALYNGSQKITSDFHFYRDPFNVYMQVSRQQDTSNVLTHSPRVPRTTARATCQFAKLVTS